MEKSFFHVEHVKTILSDKLQAFGVDDYVLNKYSQLINNIEFININLDKDPAKLHLKMVAALFSRQAENNKTFLKNIIQQAELEEIDKIIVSDYNEDDDLGLEQVKLENIDFDFGTNRRVNKIDCFLKDDKEIAFTLSTDLRQVSEQESNTYLEKQVLETDQAKANPILQDLYGYFERDFSGQTGRFIAKEYLPGKNIAHYLKDLELEADYVSEYYNISNDLAYTMAKMYQAGKGKLLSDLKLENLIYNYINPDEVEYSCRVCDNAGPYLDQAKESSVEQILSQLQSLLSYLHLHKLRLKQENLAEDISQEEMVAQYLDTFWTNLDDDSKNIFYQTLLAREKGSKPDLFSIDADLEAFVVSYLNNL